ncbi:hypothetical protein ABT160_13740 [Streptomyces sp. NPDC001941]|uniref:hypothetical protein n=1 Tax=Streptomyces sp. NPDC001941 TaxID=3154659 RepID=UPI00331C7C7D
MAFFWFLLLVAVVLGFIGVLVKGLLWLLFVGIAVFLIALFLLRGRGRGRRARR